VKIAKDRPEDLLVLREVDAAANGLPLPLRSIGDGVADAFGWTMWRQDVERLDPKDVQGQRTHGYLVDEICEAGVAASEAKVGRAKADKAKALVALAVSNGLAAVEAVDEIARKT
jgi:hypothetical protein